jgi:hypothetical protein
MSVNRLLTLGKWVLFLVGVLVACLPLAFELYVRHVEHTLATRIASIHRSGAPTTLAEIAGPPLPDSENAAPVYQQAFKALNLNSDNEKLLEDATRGRVDAADAAALAQVRAVLTANTQTLALLRRAVQMPGCRFPVKWKAKSCPPPAHWLQLPKCALLPATQAVLLARSGDARGALGACATSFGVEKSLAEERTVQSQLIRYWLLRIACHALEQVLSHSGPPALQSAALADYISQIDLKKAYLAALEGDRAEDLSTVNDIMSARDPIAALKAVLPEDPLGERVSPVAVLTTRAHSRSPFLRLALAQDALSLLDIWDRTVQLGQVPYRELWLAYPQPDVLLFRLSPFAQPLTYKLYHSYDLPVRQRDLALAHLGLAQIALHLKAYHATHGAYPASLPALEQATGRSLPPDPFSGEPFAYRRQPQGFLLYSWGCDLNDDDGAPLTNRGGLVGEGDLVFRCLR